MGDFTPMIRYVVTIVLDGPQIKNGVTRTVHVTNQHVVHALSESAAADFMRQAYPTGDITVAVRPFQENS